MNRTTGPEDSFAQRLRAERKRMGLSQTQFMKYGGVQKGAQVNYENGCRKPDVAYLESLHAHGVDVAYLITGKRMGEPTSAATVTGHTGACLLTGAILQAVQAEMAAERARIRERADLLHEINRRRSRLRASGVPEPSLRDLLDQPEDPPSPALRSAIERLVQTVGDVALPTPPVSGGDGARLPADSGAS